MNNKQEIIDKITRICVEGLGDKLKCLLHLGSSLGELNTANDIDLIVILKSRETVSDLQVINKLIQEIPLDVDVQIINQNDIAGWNFSHHTHGQFFAYFLQHADILHGTNPFHDIKIPKNYLYSSVYQKVQYYYCRAKTKFIDNTNNEAILEEKECAFHRKKILLMLIDYWFITKEEINTTKNADYKQIMNSLGLDELYKSNISFFKLDHPKVNYRIVFNIYQQISNRIFDQLKDKVSSSIT